MLNFFTLLVVRDRIGIGSSGKNAKSQIFAHFPAERSRGVGVGNE